MMSPAVPLVGEIGHGTAPNVLVLVYRVKVFQQRNAYSNSKTDLTVRNQSAIVLEGLV